MNTLLAAALLSSTTALAGPTDGSVSVLLGTSTAFDEDPETLRLSLRGETPSAGGEVLGASFLLPVTVVTHGEDSFGIDTQYTLVELPASVRLRLLPDKVVSIFGDAGLGLAIGTRNVDSWFGDDTDSSTAFMTRTALGAEIGDPDGLAFVIEPASLSTYHTTDAFQADYGLMLGLSVNL